MPKAIFMKALTRENRENRENREEPASGPVTSIVSMELMSHLGVGFPQGHLDVDQMVLLAEAGHTVMGYDVVMPLRNLQAVGAFVAEYRKRGAQADGRNR